MAALIDDIFNPFRSNSKELFEKISSPSVKSADKLRLALLYMIKYESYNEIAQIKATLNEQGISPQKCSIIDALLD
jgi:hypothetical protein